MFGKNRACLVNHAANVNFARFQVNPCCNFPFHSTWLKRSRPFFFVLIHVAFMLHGAAVCNRNPLKILGSGR